MTVAQSAPSTCAPATAPAAVPARLSQRHALAAGLVVLAVSYTAFAVAALRTWHVGDHMFDLSVYRTGGHSVLHGLPVYGTPWYEGQWFLLFTYPPLAALVFTGPSLLPFHVNELLVPVADLTLVPLVVYLTLGLLGRRDRIPRLAATCALSGALVWLEPVISTVTFGQVDLALLALVLADLSRLDDRRTKGIGVGLAAGIKLTPGLFIVYLLLTGRRRAAAWATGTFAASVALSFALLPTDSADYWGRAAWQITRVGYVGESGNQSLAGLLARVTHTYGHPIPASYSVAAIMLILGLGLAVQAHSRGHDPLGILVCAITGLLICPISWTHHWVWWCPAIIAVGHYAHRSARADWRLWPAALTLLCAAWPSSLAETLPWTWSPSRGAAWGLVARAEIARDTGRMSLGSDVLENLYVLLGLTLLALTAFSLWRRSWRRPAPRRH